MMMRRLWLLITGEKLMGGLGNIEYCCAFSSTELVFIATIQKFWTKTNFPTAESSSKAFSTGTQPGSSTSTGDRSAAFDTFVMNLIILLTNPFSPPLLPVCLKLLIISLASPRCGHCHDLAPAWRALARWGQLWKLTKSDKSWQKWERGGNTFFLTLRELDGTGIMIGAVNCQVQEKSLSD